MQNKKHNQILFTSRETDLAVSFTSILCLLHSARAFPWRLVYLVYIDNRQLVGKCAVLHIASMEVT